MLQNIISKYTKIVDGFSFAPDPAGGAYSFLSDPPSCDWLRVWHLRVDELLSWWGCLAVSQTLQEIISFRLQLSEIVYFWIIEQFSENSNSTYTPNAFLV